MQLPFTAEDFLGLFERYNLAIWPAQVVMYGLGLVAIGLSIWKTRQGDRVISAILGVFWLWIGIVFLVVFYRELNGMVAVGFGLLLAIQGILFIYCGVVRQELHFSAGGHLQQIVGALFIVYALAIYPVLGALAGHGFPRSPVFGVAPCPTTIFTFGLMLWVDEKLPRYLLAIPFLWSVFAVGAALGLGIYEDVAMPLSGIIAVLLILLRPRQQTPEGFRQPVVPM